MNRVSRINFVWCFVAALALLTVAPRVGRAEQHDVQATGADPRILDLLSQVTSAGKNLQTLRASVTFRDLEEGDRSKRVTDLLLKRPNFFRFGDVVCDGKRLWDLANKDARCWAPAPADLADAAPQAGHRLPLPLSGNEIEETATRIGGDLRYVGEQPLDGQTCRVIEAAGPLETVRWYVSSSGLVRAVRSEFRLEVFAGKPIFTRQEWLLNRPQLNVPISSEQFTVPAQRAMPTESMRELDLEWVSGMPAVGAAANDFVLPLTSGGTLRLSDIFKEKRVTVLYIWSVHCGNCFRCLPQLQRLYEKGIGVVLVHQGRVDPMLDEAESKDVLRDMMNRLHLTMPVAIDISSQVCRDYGDFLSGAFLVIDHNGHLVAKGTHVWIDNNGLDQQVPGTQRARLASPHESPVAWDVQLDPPAVMRGQMAVLVIRATLMPGWHIYAPDTRGIGLPTSIRLDPAGPLASAGEAVKAIPASATIENAARLELPVRVVGPVGEQRATVYIDYQACTHELCRAPERTVREVHFSVQVGSRTAPADTTTRPE